MLLVVRFSHLFFSSFVLSVRIPVLIGCFELSSFEFRRQENIKDKDNKPHMEDCRSKRVRQDGLQMPIVLFEELSCMLSGIMQIFQVSMPGCFYPERHAMPKFRSRKQSQAGSILYQKRQMRRSKMRSPSPAKGPYCLSSNSQLIRTAARLYLRESSRSRDDISPIDTSCQKVLCHILVAYRLTHFLQRVSSV